MELENGMLIKLVGTESPHTSVMSRKNFVLTNLEPAPDKGEGFFKGRLENRTLNAWGQEVRYHYISQCLRDSNNSRVHMLVSAEYGWGDTYAWYDFVRDVEAEKVIADATAEALAKAEAKKQAQLEEIRREAAEQEAHDREMREWATKWLAPAPAAVDTRCRRCRGYGLLNCTHSVEEYPELHK